MSTNIRETLYQCIETTASTEGKYWKLFSVIKTNKFSIDCHIIYTYNDKTDYLNINFASGTVTYDTETFPYYKIYQCNNSTGLGIHIGYVENNNIYTYYIYAQNNDGVVSILPTIKKNIHFGDYEELLSQSSENDPICKEITVLTLDTYNASNGRYIETNEKTVVFDKITGKDKSSSSISNFNSISANTINISGDSTINNVQITDNTITANTFAGNASSATVLKTSRNIWGQSFNGSSAISGDITGTGNITPTNNNSYSIGSTDKYYNTGYFTTINAIDVKATTFSGELSGTATNVKYSIKFKDNSNKEKLYNGSEELDLTNGIYHSVTSDTASNATKLNNQEASYYLDYANFDTKNISTLIDSATKLSINSNNKITHNTSTDGGNKSSALYKIATDECGHISTVESVTKQDITDLGIPGQDTTYDSLSATQNGTVKSLVTTGEKYNWNQHSTVFIKDSNNTTKTRIDDITFEFDSSTGTLNISYNTDK